MDAQDLNPLQTRSRRPTRGTTVAAFAASMAVRPPATVVALSACTMLGTMLAVGSAARADGLVGCWGINDFGQCVVPPSVVIATQVAAGSDHSVALRSDGTVACWGENSVGQTTVPGGLGACTAIAAGHFHTVALRSAGTVACWGSNIDGQSTVPAGLGTVTAIAAGGAHTLAVRTAGTVAAWGFNGFGQTTVPATLGTCTRVAAGSDHSLALRSNGTVAAWGYNLFGQTGVPATLGTCTAIAGGFDHSVALRTAGTVACWGDNTYGQCNVPVNLGACTAIAAGFNHTVALRTNGQVVAWGLNDNGQGTVPVTVPACNRIAAGAAHNVVVGSMPVIQLASVTPTTCGLSNGAVDLTVTNGVSIAWTGPNGFTATTADLANVAAGTYVVTVTGPAFTNPASAQVVVQAAADTTAPTVASYTNALSAPANAACQAPVANFVATVVATDNCAVTSITQTPSAGTLVGLGNTAVTITVRDAANNTVTRSATFTATGSSATFYRDADADTFGTPATTATGCAAPSGFVSNNLDCNDADASINPNTVWYRDLDGDGAGNAADGTLTQCAAPAGYVRSNTDGCPTDPAKTAPGACGCGTPDTDSDGDTIADCLDNCDAIANPDQRDCDANGVGDACQIAAGTPPDCNGNGAYDVPAEIATIQAAIDAVGPGTPRIVLVAAGTYAGPVSLRGKNLELRGAGAATCILDGTGLVSSSVLTFAGGEVATTVVEGFTIRGGTAGTPVTTGALTERYGGGVFARNASGRIRACVIESNAAQLGGGIALVNAAIALESSIVRGNAASIDGGGVSMFGSALAVAGSTITLNTAPYGGGIAIEAPSGSSALSLEAAEVCTNTVWNIVGAYTEAGDPSNVCDCRGDIDGNGQVNAVDIAALLSVWNTDAALYPRADGNSDGQINAQDIAIMLSGWGACP